MDDHPGRLSAIGIRERSGFDARLISDHPTGERMKPTMKLRWIERMIPCHRPDIGKAVCTLRQWWEGNAPNQILNYDYIDPKTGYPAVLTPRGEWRDVPIETE